MMAEAEAAGECLRFVGVVDLKAGAGSVELRRYPKVGGWVGVGMRRAGQGLCTCECPTGTAATYTVTFTTAG